MALLVYDFAKSDPLLALPRTGQVEYLHDYLADLSASSVVEEDGYFDRDYLSEYAAFYSTTSRGYGNRCRRLHYFSGPAVTQSELEKALGGDPQTEQALQRNYMGFVVVRPIPAAPLGRTVLRWYDDNNANTPRITRPARTYEVHLAGLKLEIVGLAWQQQDSAVGACATVALWSLLHSSAFDEHHAIPTTADLTRFANRTMSLGARVFPSDGLTVQQILEAIKQTGLAPVIVHGNQTGGPSDRVTFSRDRFSTSFASLVRAGFPVILTGRMGDGLHAVCAVGFRDVGASIAAPGMVSIQDETIQHIYVNDDNIGPNGRFRIDEDPLTKTVSLVRDPPPARNSSAPTPSRQRTYPAFIPHGIIAAVPETLRTSPLQLNEAGVRIGSLLATLLNQIAPPFGGAVGARFVKVSEYLGAILPDTIGRGSMRQQQVLSRVRIALTTDVNPLSLHIGLVRFSLAAIPILDLVFDTSDSDRHLKPDCCVVFQPAVTQLLQAIQAAGLANFGIQIDGF